MSVRFSDGVRLTMPSPISHNINRKAMATAAHAKAATLTHALKNATVGGAPTPGPTTTFARPPSAAKLKV